MPHVWASGILSNVCHVCGHVHSPYDEEIVARAPRHFREYHENGEEYFWLMLVPLYGQSNAGHIWNRTWDEHMCKVEEYHTDEACPAVYSMLRRWARVAVADAISPTTSMISKFTPTPTLRARRSTPV